MPDPPAHPPAFHDVLAGTTHVAAGGDDDAGRWQVWADPDDRDPSVYVIGLPPAGRGGAVALLRFELVVETGLAVVTTAGTLAAATGSPDAARVVLTDADGASVALEPVYRRPWWSHQLFAGSTAPLGGLDHGTAYDVDGRVVGHQDLSRAGG